MAGKPVSKQRRGAFGQALVFVVKQDLLQAIRTFPGKGKSHPNAFLLKGIADLVWQVRIHITGLGIDRNRVKKIVIVKEAYV
jgi:hypothetical protein